MGKRQGLAAGMAAALGVGVAQLFAGSAVALPRAHPVRLAGHPITVAVPAFVKPPPVKVPTVPTVTVPTVTVPPVTAPAVTTPPAPVTTPKVHTPSAGSSPIHGATSQHPSSSHTGAASGPSVPPAPTPPVSTPRPAPSPTGGTSTGSASGAATPATPTPAAPAPSHATAARSHRHAARHHRARARRHARATSPAVSPQTRQLQALVRRLRGCLSTLDPASRRLLSLRSGLGGGGRSAAPLAPLAAARALGVGLGRERLLERLAVMGLNRSAATGCAGGAGGAAGGSPAAAVSTSALTPGAPWMGGAVPAATTSPATSVSAAHATRPQVNVTNRAASHGVERAGAGDQSFPVAAIPAFVTLLLGIGLVAFPGVRRRLLSPPRQPRR